MRKIQLTAFGEPDVLTVRDHPEPTLPDDGYLVEVKAAGINYADVVERRGRYRKDQQLPFEVGKEAGGIVLERGPRAAEFEVGERVVVVRLKGGCYAERVAVGPTEILPAPPELTFEELAALPICYATAWYGMMEIARVRPGESVLVQAAAGGVGTAALHLARAYGCAPILGTAGGPAKCAWSVDAGADVCVDYLQDDFLPLVRDRTDGRGVDYVLESVGGEVFDKSLEALAPMGRLVLIGFSSIDSDYAERIRRVHPLTVFHRSISLAGLNVHNLDFPSRRKPWHELCSFVTEHGIRPRVGLSFPLEEAPAAHAALEERRSTGKVVLIP